MIGSLGLENFLSFIMLYGYAAVFTCIFLGGLGLPMPSNTILFTAGAFASQGYFNFFIVLLVAVLANVLGDFCIYTIIKKCGPKLVAKNYHKKFYFIIKRAEHRIQPLKERLQRHALVAIAATRFVSPLNTITTLLSATAPVPAPTFITASAIGNSISISIVLTLGFFVSQSWQYAIGVIGLAGTIISVAILIAIIIITVHLVQKKRRRKV